jgi:hypothetical protein
MCWLESCSAICLLSHRTRFAMQTLSAFAHICISNPPSLSPFCGFSHHKIVRNSMQREERRKTDLFQFKSFCRIFFFLHCIDGRGGLNQSSAEHEGSSVTLSSSLSLSLSVSFGFMLAYKHVTYLLNLPRGGGSGSVNFTYSLDSVAATRICCCCDSITVTRIFFYFGPLSLRFPAISVIKKRVPWLKFCTCA